jgi:histone H3/H4
MSDDSELTAIPEALEPVTEELEVPKKKEKKKEKKSRSEAIKKPAPTDLRRRKKKLASEVLKSVNYSSLRKLSHMAGVIKMSPRVVLPARAFAREFAEALVRRAVIYMTNDCRVTVRPKHVAAAARDFGLTYYHTSLVKTV